MSAPSSDTKDFCVQSIIYNNHIFTRMMARGLAYGGTPSIGKLYERTGYSYSYYKVLRDLIGLRMVPIDQNGDWRPVALKLAEVLGATPDELWPGKLKHQIPDLHAIVQHVAIGETAEWLIME